MSKSRSTRPRQAARAVATATCTLAATAGVAHAAPGASYDQISRASGAAGVSPGIPYFAQPVFASDTGRYAAYTDNQTFDTDPTHVFPEPKLRDIVANTTVASGIGNHTELVGVDAAERTELVARLIPNGGGTQFIVRPVTGGPEKSVYTDTVDGATAALSGDGKWVAISGQSIGTREINVATGTTKQLGTQLLDLTVGSISDDGSVVGGSYSLLGNGGYFKGTTFTQVDRPVIVSPNGATVAWSTGSFASSNTLTARNVATGKNTVTTLAASAPTQIRWISPDGSQVVLGGTEPGPGNPSAVSVNTSTGAVSPFGGAYGSYLSGNAVGSTFDQPYAVISRSGRYAAIRFQNQVALVDLNGKPLPGGGDPLTAQTYLRTAAWRTCSTPDTSFAMLALQTAATWAPTIKAAAVSIKFDGKVVGSAVLTRAIDDNPQQDITKQNSLVIPTLPQTVKTVTFSAVMVDTAGHVITGTTTAPPTSFC